MELWGRFFAALPDGFFTIDKVAAIIFFIVSAINFFGHLKKIDLDNVTKGDDGKHQLPEIAALYWFRLFPILFFGDFFLGFEASEKIWMSMDAIFLVIMGSHSLISLNKKKNTSEQEDDDRNS